MRYTARSRGRLSVPAGTCNFPAQAPERETAGRCSRPESACQPARVEVSMPPREPHLPEGTDQIVNGPDAANDGSSGFVARGGNGTTDRLVSQVKDQVTSLRGQAGDKLRSVADDGKSRATTILDDVAEIIEDAARSIDERLG